MRGKEYTRASMCLPGLYVPNILLENDLKLDMVLTLLLSHVKFGVITLTVATSLPELLTVALCSFFGEAVFMKVQFLSFNC